MNTGVGRHMGKRLEHLRCVAACAHIHTTSDRETKVGGSDKYVMCRERTWDGKTFATTERTCSENKKLSHGSRRCRVLCEFLGASMSIVYVFI